MSKYKEIVIFFCITMLNYGSGSSYTELQCNFTCNANHDPEERYECKDKENRYFRFLSHRPWQPIHPSNIASVTVSNGNNCSTQMKVSDLVFEIAFLIEVFHMNDSNVDAVSYENFRSGDYLQNLSLSHNNIKELPPFLFGVSRNLRYVDLSFNKIEKISENAFAKQNTTNDYIQDFKYLNLQHIHLDNNLISFLEPHVFSSLEKLELLTLHNNLLSEIDGSVVFGTNSKLKLYLNSNPLTKVSNISYFQFINLSDNPNMEEFVVNAVHARLCNVNAKVLIIGDHAQRIFSTHNRINSLYASDDSTEFSLIEIDLQSNSLNSMWNFTLFKYLVSVNLGSNLFETLDTRIFEKLPHLAYLNLSHNYLDEFDSNILLVTNLKTLDVSYNRLKHFNGVSNKLRKLCLAGNHLTVIDSNFNMNIPNLRSLSMQDNDWNCQYLIRKILVLEMHNVQIETAAFDLANNKRNFDSNVKGIGCFTQSDNVKRQSQLKNEIENMIDERLKAFELEISEHINALFNDI